MHLIIWDLIYLQGGFIIDTTSGKCLQGELSQDLSLQLCDPDNKRQRWRFSTYNSVYFQMINSEDVSSIHPSLLNTFSKYTHLALKKRLKRKENKFETNPSNNQQLSNNLNFMQKE